MFENTKDIRKTEKRLFEAVYGWGKFGVVTDELCPTFQHYMDRLQFEWHERFCEMYDICSACGEPNVDGHYNNNAECKK